MPHQEIAVRFGCCVGEELIGAAVEAGYDFIELPAAALMPERPDAEFRSVQESLSTAAIKPEAWALSLPAGVRVCGPSVDWPRLARYAHTALRRMASVGGSVVAFGAAEARAVPRGFPRDHALTQVSDFLRVCGAVARMHGLIVGIEPLSAGSADLINDLPEAVAAAQSVGSPETGVLPSFRHMTANDQSLLDIVDAADWLAHVHISAADLQPGANGESIREFAQALRLADYDGRVSVQGEWSDPKRQLRSALESLRNLWEGV